jgi:hypothetical protein
MSGIASIGGAANIQFAAEYSAKVAGLQKSAQEQAGENALKLIQAASIDTGQTFDVSI